MSHNPMTAMTTLMMMDSRGNPGMPLLFSDSDSGSDSVSVVSSSGAGCSTVCSPKPKTWTFPALVSPPTSASVSPTTRARALVRHGLIDKNLAYDMGGTGYIQAWNKYGEIVKTQRELYNIPNYCIHWEYLYEEMVKIAKQRGQDITSEYNISYTDEVKQKMTS